MVIDHEYFPRIMDAIIAYAPPESLAVLASTCRAFRDRLGFASHIVVTASEQFERFRRDIRLSYSGAGSAEPYFNDIGSHSWEYWKDVALSDPILREAFRRIRFLDFRDNDLPVNCVIPVLGSRPEYIRVQGLNPDRHLRRAEGYTVVVEQQEYSGSSDARGYPRQLLPPCRCHTDTITVVLRRLGSGTRNTRREYAVHWVGPDARDDSRLRLGGSSRHCRARSRHPKVAIGTLEKGSAVDRIPDYYESNWLRELWESTRHIEYLTLEEYAARRRLSQAEINFERGVLDNIYDPAPAAAPRRVL